MQPVYNKVFPRWLVVLLGLYVILGITYLEMLPLFESPDESSHLQVIHYMQQQRNLPPQHVLPQRVTARAVMAQSLHYHTPPYYYSPPLYHMLGALLTVWTPMDDLAIRLIPSPSWETGYAPQPNSDPWNKNIYVHLPGETWAGSPTVRAAWTLRAFSLALGLMPILCAHTIARWLWPAHPAMALGAAAFVSLNPQDIAISVGVTNDPLTNALFSMGLLGMVYAIHHTLSPWQWAALGGLVGAGMLTKQSALLLLPLGGLALWWQPLPEGYPRWRKRLTDGATFAIVILLVSGGWYAWNALRYGDLLGLHPHFASQAPLTRLGVHEIVMIFQSYFVGLGWTLIFASPWVYRGLALLAFVAFSGVVRALWPGGAFWCAPRSTRRGLIFLGIAAALNVFSLVRWIMATGAPYSRLLFPTTAAYALMLVWGLAQWRNLQAARWGFYALVGAGVFLAAMVPWTLLRPAFAMPHVTGPLPKSATPVTATFAPGVRLLGYDLASDALKPGRSVNLTTYWEVTRSSDERYTLWVQLTPQDPTQRVAASDRWLGGTMYPVTLWQSGDIVRHVSRLDVAAWTPVPALYWLHLGLTDEKGARIPLIDNTDTFTLGPWRIRAKTDSPRSVHPTDFRFGDYITLRGYDVAQLDGAHIITLTWAADGVPAQNYTVFVHLQDATGALIGQHDGPPANGTYPPVWWLPGDIIRDRHVLKAPVEPPARFAVGLYNSTTGMRLSAYTPDGTRLRDDVVILDFGDE